MNDQQVIFSMVRVSRVFPPGNKPVLRDISLGFFYGAKIGVLGLNGAGKSTLLRIIAGLDDGYTGEVVFSPGYSVGLLEQEPQLDPGKTVKQVVEEAVQPVVDALRQFDEVSARFAEPDADFDALIEEQGRLQEYLDQHDAWTLDNRLELALDALRCPPGATPVSVLSGGECRRVALTRLLLTEPDILLLDEPTNHLDAESVAWLERHLQQYKGTVIAVTHDRYFLDNVAGWILELDRGFGIPWKGNYSSWLEQKQERLRREEKAESKRLQTLQRELEWIHMSPKARQAKGRARVNAYENLLSQEVEKRREDLELYLPPGPRLGELVIRLEHVSKGYGERLLIDDLPQQGLRFGFPQLRAFTPARWLAGGDTVAAIRDALPTHASGALPVAGFQRNERNISRASTVKNTANGSATPNATPSPTPPAVSGERTSITAPRMRAIAPPTPRMPCPANFASSTNKAIASRISSSPVKLTGSRCIAKSASTRQMPPITPGATIPGCVNSA